MRGSPLIRTLFLSLALMVAAAGLLHVTAAQSHPATEKTVATPSLVKTTAEIPYQLQLSSQASEILLDSGVSRVSASSGLLQLDPENPHLSLLVRWKTPAAAGEQRFAKLTLEIPGQPTLTHVFDSDGDIDDLLELPIVTRK